MLPMEIVNGYENWISISVNHLIDTPIQGTFTSYPLFNISYVIKEEVLLVRASLKLT